jgi:thiol-disulfide isomerase/thioredoxin
MSIIYNITTERQFKRLVSKTNTINVLNFWALWAEPCKQMNEVFNELAGKFPSLTYIQVVIFYSIFKKKMANKYNRLRQMNFHQYQN